MAAIPGGVGFVDGATLRDQYVESLGDALNFTPGVVADVSAPRESRISVRGSGISSTFERRGLTLLRDGVPITRASGSTEFQEVDPSTIGWIEVFKGANGLRFGAASLGGAVNIVSPNGRSRPGFGGSAEGGSFGTWRANVQAGGASGNADWWAGITARGSDGYRAQSASRGVFSFVNVGLKFSPDVESRFYLTALSDQFELSGALSLEDALQHPDWAQQPTMMDPGPVADDWDRNLSVIRLSNRTVADLGPARLEGGAWVSWRGLDHAITRMAGIIDQSEDEVGGFASLSNRRGSGRQPIEWVVGVQANRAVTLARTFANQSGERGEIRSFSVQRADNLQAYGQLDAALPGGVRLIAGGQYLEAGRAADARLNAVSGDLSYRHFSPRLGLLWERDADWQVFANWSSSFEPPTMSDLTSGGAYPFQALKAQRAETLEVGTRGRWGPWSVDVSAWESRVRNEFIDTLAPNGRTSVTMNAGRTLKRGVEAGADLFIRRADESGPGLLWRNVWTFSDFRFDGDAIYGDGRLAGIPRHLFSGELRMEGMAGWFVAARLRWVPEGPYVDFANTEKAPGYALWGLGAGWKMGEGLRLTLTAENLFNRRYISNVSTVANQQAERAAAYTPGTGRAVYAGASVQF